MKSVFFDNSERPGRIIIRAKRKNLSRLRMAAALLSAVAFSLCAVPPIIRSLPDGTAETVSDGIKGGISLEERYTVIGQDVASETAATERFNVSAPVTTETEEACVTETTEIRRITENTKEIKTVEAVNLSRYTVSETPRLFLMNETGYKVDLNELSKMMYSFRQQKGNDPLVLVVHTHGTECYLPDGVDTYDDDTKYRSTDSALNVVGVGNAFCAELERNGIRTIHDVTMYDETDFNNAYTYSRAAMRKYLKEYPSIAYIVDIHRDTVFNSENENKKPVVYINGEATAQVMLVIGTDESGSSHKDWKTNLVLASKLQQKFNEYPTFARPVYLRKASYNQQLSEGAFLLEVGSCGNTVTEARNAARLAAKQFADLVKFS